MSRLCRITVACLALATAAALLALPCAPFAHSSLPPECGDLSAFAYTAHLPIHIVGDGNFTPANGVSDGAGTAADPYIISGWDIDAGASIGIHIEQTSAFFIAKSCRVTGGGSLNSGIMLSDCTNGRVESCTLAGNMNGVELWQCSGCAISLCNITSNTWNGISSATSYMSSFCNNTIQGNSANGIDIRCSPGKYIIRDNAISGNGENGIYHARAKGSEISTNSINDNGKWGYFNDHARNATVLGNDVSGNAGGILIASGNDPDNRAENCSVTQNDIRNSAGDGLSMLGCRNITATKNSISDSNGYGINCSNGSGSCSVYANRISGNNGAGSYRSAGHIQARDDGVGNIWSSTTKGNEWSDWPGPDSDADGVVDAPYSLDGTALATDTLPAAASAPVKLLHHITVHQAPRGPYKIGQNVSIAASAWADDAETENITENVTLLWETSGGVSKVVSESGANAVLRMTAEGEGGLSVTCSHLWVQKNAEVQFSVGDRGAVGGPAAGMNAALIVGAATAVAAAVSLTAIIIKRRKKPEGSK